jgi:1,4-alpha-glucan branching enzyme
MKFIFTLLLAYISSFTYSQILNVEPIFPKEDDTVTIIYDATFGNGALKDISGDVYAHAGLITTKSTSGVDWKYVQGTWATNDLKVKMTSLGNNRFKIKYHIKSFYGLPTGETALKLAFVFRNLDGSKVGRETDGSDIFFTLYSTGFSSKITSHTSSYVFGKIGDSILISGASSSNSNLELSINGVQVKTETGTTISYKYGINTSCISIVVLKSVGSSTLYDTLYVITPDLNNIDVMPNGAEDGVTYLSNTKIRFSLYAPGKEFVYVIGDFNNWTPSCAYQLKKTPDGKRFWLEVSGFIPGKENVFQYIVDGKIKIADPYSQVVLDPNNDGSISSLTYPNLKKYPTGMTTGLVTLLQPGKTPYAWQTTSYIRPKKTDLVVYELLVRDFIAARNFKVLKDTLGYLKRMGINCIELMPVMEFEGNNSWGYNVSYHGALDKANGSIDDFKKFIDECHKQNIAVVLDIALNHAFSQNSLCQLYWDATNFRPAADNPWLNVTAKHPYNVGYDFNHESLATQYYVDKILKYWIEEFKIDGYRFDLSKGFTQKYTGEDVGAWGQYDQSRVNLIKRMGDKIRAVDNNAFLILEHFADNSEETVLQNNGFMLWGNLVYAYNEATMGFTNDLSWGSYKARGWSQPNVVTYLESHDEERLMVKNTKFGNFNGSYNVKDINTSLKRMELAGAFFFTIPGPKMFWQFGELGYDVSIDQNGRTGEKPIYWNYQTNKGRKNLYNVWSSLINLRTTQDVFETTDYTVNLNSMVKSIYLNHASMNAVVLGNFNVTTQSVTANFQQTGKWYEFFKGDSITITSNQQTFSFAPGEYRLYTTKRLANPNSLVAVNKLDESQIVIYPNPAQSEVFIGLDNKITGKVTVNLVDATGRVLVTDSITNATTLKLHLPELTSGVYFLQIQSVSGNLVKRVIIK